MPICHAMWSLAWAISRSIWKIATKLPLLLRVCCHFWSNSRPRINAVQILPRRDQTGTTFFSIQRRTGYHGKGCQRTDQTQKWWKYKSYLATIQGWRMAYHRERFILIISKFRWNGTAISRPFLCCKLRGNRNNTLFCYPTIIVCHNVLCMIFDCINGRNANERSLTYTPLLGWEGASEPKGRGSNRTTMMGVCPSQHPTAARELARAHQPDLTLRNKHN